MNKILFEGYKFSIDICDLREGILNTFIYIEEDNKFSSFFINIDFKRVLDSSDLYINIRNGKNLSNDILICRLIDRTIRPIICNLKVSINITCLEYNYSKMNAIYAALLAFNYIFDNSVHFAWIENDEIDMFIGHCNDCVLSIEMHGKEISSTKMTEYVEKALKVKLPDFKQSTPFIIDKNTNITTFECRADNRENLNIRNINIVNHHKGDCVLFTRGGTSVLTQMHFNIFSENESVFNYDFGNNRKNRREIGHSELIKKSFEYIIPKFLQINSSSYVQNCDGSSSMASVSGLSICLKNLSCIDTLVGGITIGFYFYAKNKVKYILDITADEDATMSNMDLKCAGTKNGFTAIQMDCKKLYNHNFKKIFTIGQNGINHIIDKMEEKTFKTSQVFREYTLDKNRIGVFIGTNGKKVKKISSISNAMIRVDKNGLCVVKHDNFKIFEEFYNFYNYCEVKDGKLITKEVKAKSLSLILKEKYENNCNKICTSFGDIILEKGYDKDIEKDEAISILIHKNGNINIKQVY